MNCVSIETEKERKEVEEKFGNVSGRETEKKKLSSVHGKNRFGFFYSVTTNKAIIRTDMTLYRPLMIKRQTRLIRFDIHTTCKSTFLVVLYFIVVLFSVFSNLAVLFLILFD